MRGKIIRGIAGFYYVHVVESGIYECKAKGIFRKQNRKPLVGDEVCIQITDEKDKEGNIIEIFERKNALIRPAVANIDQALVIFAVTKPAPNLNLLDRFLVMMERQGIPSVLCFNKKDLAGTQDVERLTHIYRNSGCRMVFTSAVEQDGLQEIGEILRGKTTAVAGPSGVGKSSLINCLSQDTVMAVGEISSKIDRGKHTTRHSELIYIEEDTYIMDTPGFSSLYVNDFEKEELRDYFPEFEAYRDQCRFLGCVHMQEPGCAVKAALAEGAVSHERYNSYQHMFEELKNQRRY